MCDDSNPCTQDSCDPASGCVYDPSPMVGCRGAAKTKLVIQRGRDDTKDLLTFQWLNGTATVAELADPTATAEYALCVYDADAVVLRADVPSAAICPTSADHTHPCWTATKTGYKFKDKTGGNDGITSVGMKGNATDPKAKIQLKGKGANLPDPGQPLTPPVTAQMINAETGLCVEGTFSGSGILRNDATQFKAKAP